MTTLTNRLSSYRRCGGSYGHGLILAFLEFSGGLWIHLNWGFRELIPSTAVPEIFYPNIFKNLNMEHTSRY
jgi:hypothetical protein